MMELLLIALLIANMFCIFVNIDNFKKSKDIIPLIGVCLNLLAIIACAISIILRTS